MATFQLTESSRDKPQWRMVIEGEKLRLEGPDGIARTLDNKRNRRNVKPDLLELGVITIFVERRVNFARDPAAGKALLDWLGPPTREDLRVALLERHAKPMLYISLFMILMSTPWVFPGWLQSGLGGEEGFDLLLLGWGAGSILMWLGVRAVVHRGWFLADGVFNTAITAWWVFGVVQGDRSPWWLLITPVALLGWMASTRSYRRFGRIPRD